jgi:opacity protein-like surface antigen
MGRLKTLWSIGVILGLSAPAVAADFSPPPPPPPGPIVSELGSGWYLRGDVGWVEFSIPASCRSAPGCPSTASA